MSCGAQSFREIPVGQVRRSVLPAPDDHLKISVFRVFVLSILSLGLYQYYWFYRTWKELASETDDVHYPLWHALSLAVPVYGLFRIYAHMALIKGLALKKGVVTTLSPGMVVVLVLVSEAVNMATVNVTGATMLVWLSIIKVTLIVSAIVWAQSALNGYWASSRGTALRATSISVAEVVFAFLGLLLWAGTFSPDR
jgi:hypothetical protein